MKIKIRDEKEESVSWRKLVMTYDDSTLERKPMLLMNGGTAIRKILSAILLELK